MTEPLDGAAKRYALTVRWSDDDGVWIADAPDLRYCSAHGATLEEAVRELTVAMELWIETVLEAGEALPEPRFRAPAASVGRALILPRRSARANRPSPR